MSGARAALLLAAGLLAACDPSPEQKAEWTEARRIECLDKICEGDVLPPHDVKTETVFKINGQWLIAPRQYAKGFAGLAFYWPSRTPITGGGLGKNFPEFGHEYASVAVEIFLRSSNIPAEPHGYKLIELAERNDWIAERVQIRPGLQAVRMKHVIGPRGYYIDHVTYYVATELKGNDGLPPVATCNNSRADGGGGTGFMWQPGIWAGTRMNQKHCADWPEIYQEVVRVLQLIRKG